MTQLAVCMLSVSVFVLLVCVYKLYAKLLCVVWCLNKLTEIVAKKNEKAKNQIDNIRGTVNKFVKMSEKAPFN